jgi:Protein of unknown function (DUF3082)
MTVTCRIIQCIAVLLCYVMLITNAARVVAPFVKRGVHGAFFNVVRGDGARRIASSQNQYAYTTQLMYARDDDGDRRPVMNDDISQPRIAVRDYDEEKRQTEAATRRADAEAARKKAAQEALYQKTSSSERSAGSKKVFGNLSIEELNRKSGIKTKMDAGFVAKKEDLNGINPITPLTFSVFPAIMAYVGYQATNYLVGHFAIDFVESPIYPIQRAAIVARNVIVGISTLATGFCGVVSVGLFLLGIAVSVGVLKGELDPSKDTAVFDANGGSNAPSNSDSIKDGQTKG